MTTVTLPREVVQQALSRAYSLGQTYWQQADSESYKQNAKAGITDATFKQLVVDTCAALDAPAKPGDCRGCEWYLRGDEIERLRKNAEPFNAPVDPVG